MVLEVVSNAREVHGHGDVKAIKQAFRPDPFKIPIS